MILEIWNIHPCCFHTGAKLTVEGRTYTLKNNVYVVGFGKAVSGMARTLEDHIGQHIVRGIISIPLGSQELFHAHGKEYVFHILNFVLFDLIL